ncbi:MAG TPA: TIGR02281 family clan AA aspartic protease [Sphingomonadaceae bacterium]|nr:TIGR02281 family clan AA aspartic protease [Sphingomonadaceae bacterium]
MNADTIASSSYYILLLVLLVSAGAVRRLPIKRTLAMILGWVAIFAVGFVLVSVKDDVSDVLVGRASDTAVADGSVVRIPISGDGHFWVDARINGAPVRLMVDSGATVTTLSPTTARAAGIEPSGLPVLVGTANGTIQIRRGRAERFEVGTIVREDLSVHLANEDFDVVGMNFLGKLTRWSVEGRWLILQP